MTNDRSVVLFAPNWLGDAVMALPAMADVSRHFTPVRVVVAARPAVAALYSMAPCVDEVVSVDVAAIRAAGAGTAILFPNSFAAARLARQAGVPERWGYASDLRGPLLTRAVRRPRHSLHQGAYYQHLVQALGIDNGPLEPRLDVPPGPAAAARALLETHGWDTAHPLLVVAPGAAYGTAKRWLPGHFARLVSEVAKSRGVQCVLVGSASDRQTTEWVRRDVEATGAARVIDLAGLTTLEVLAGVMSLAAACVSNDSGAMHLAGAIGVPLAALFGPTREYETAPLMRAGAPSEVLINPVWCRPCMLRECPIDHRCMIGLSPAHVAGAVDRLLREGRQ